MVEPLQLIVGQRDLNSIGALDTILIVDPDDGGHALPPESNPRQSQFDSQEQILRAEESTSSPPLWFADR